MGCAAHPSAPLVCTGPASSCRRNSATAPGLPASAQSWPPLRLWMELIALLLVLFKLRNCKFQRRLHATWDQVSKATKEPADLQTGCVGGCPACEESLTDEGALCTR
ncbi:hypothetical protein AAFF_G00388710 [Aldrovandia affinis]|uniref:Uncharacterized protein n=1 Tax=Aldrovandia affinis TaxID=143900 RepID=A0AAD7R481_9TELE|nr:hypothetical protein AAFF_G00388710 [Aldrovandia affinis]